MDPSGRGWKAEPGPDIFEHIRKVFSEDHDFIAIGSTGWSCSQIYVLRYISSWLAFHV